MKRLTGTETRKCPQCGEAVWYGIYCSDRCSDKGFREWKRRNPEKVGLT